MKFSLFNNFGAKNSVPVFAAFEQGLKATGHQCSKHDMDADIAVIWSHLWSGKMKNNQPVWKHYVDTGRDVIILEVGMLKRGITWKVGLNGVNRRARFGQGYFPNRAKQLGINLQDWNQGQNIVIAAQRSDSEQWAGLPSANCWLQDTITKIKQHTMGCGCKNKGNQAAAPQQAARTEATPRPAVQNQTVQESVKKVIEKYYNKK